MIRDEIQCVLLLFTEINTLIPHSTTVFWTKREINSLKVIKSCNIIACTSSLLFDFHFVDDSIKFVDTYNI